VRGVEDEVGGCLHPRPRLLVIADVIETPLARPGLDLIGLDPLHQRVGVDVQQHVEDAQLGSLEAPGQLAPVVFPQHRLHGD
jgi:hypothetical protein